VLTTKVHLTKSYICRISIQI